jgi:hypothetical protein
LKTMPGQQQRKGGLLGGLVGLVGTGVGAAVEYHGHRKERKAAHSNVTSPSEPSETAGSSTRPDLATRSTTETPGGRASENLDGELKDDDSLSSGYDSDTPIDNDEEAWELDEVSAATEPPSYEDAMEAGETQETLVNDVLSGLRDTKVHAPLPLPVIIPQRRPRNKSRGFVRAYAPVLEDVGIPQETFLKFLKNFHKASQANPIFGAVMVAAGIAGMAPSVIAMAVCTVVQFAAGTAKELDARRKTNNFLDVINEELFKPAGCYALIVKYKSDADIAAAAAKGPSLLSKLGMSAEQVDFSAISAVAKYDAASPSGLAAKLKTIRLFSGETRGSVQLPDAAPLIYPELDAVLYSGVDGEETFKDKTRDAKKFLAAYADRRAQVAYARDDPESALTVPESERAMHSKWSDPHHPMFSNGLIGLLSGGTINMRAGKQGRGSWKQARKESRVDSKMARREAKIERGTLSPHKSARLERRNSRDERRLESRYGVRSPPTPVEERDYFGQDAQAGPGLRTGGRKNRGVKNGGPLGMVKKILREDVLYLMIVPMPSEAELAEAREVLAAEKAKK